MMIERLFARWHAAMRVQRRSAGFAITFPW